MSRIRAALSFLLVGAAASLLLGGCASNVALHWDEARSANIANQIADPGAGRVARPGPEGLDAIMAERVADRYYGSQATQKAGESKRGPVIEIGSGGSMNM